MATDLDDPRQVVALAIELEQHCSLLYQEWARRFKPYDLDISTLLETLAEEEQAHAREFRILQETLGDGWITPPVALPAEFHACIKGLEAIQDHFFVTGPVMATTILAAALQIEKRTRQLYQDLAATAGAEVAAVCRRLHALEADHALALTERLAAEQQKLPLS